MNAPTNIAKGEIERQLAKRWGCSERTIRQWRMAGAPLGDEVAMKPWLMSRHKVPPGTWAILQGKRSIEVAKPKRRVLPTEAPAEGQLGAAAALERLQVQELQSHARYIAMLQDPAATAEELEEARKVYISMLNPLRQWELAVEQDRRQSGELLPRADLDAFCRGFLANFVGSLKAGFESACPRLAGLDTPGAVWAVLGPAFARALTEATRSASAMPFAGRSAPEWLVKAIARATEEHL